MESPDTSQSELSHGQAEGEPSLPCRLESWRSTHDLIVVLLLIVVVTVFLPFWRIVGFNTAGGWLHYLGAEHAPWLQLGISALFAAAFALPFAERSEHPARLWPLLIPALSWFCYGWWELFVADLPAGAIRVDIFVIVPVLLLATWLVPLLMVIARSIGPSGLRGSQEVSRE